MDDQFQYTFGNVVVVLQNPKQHLDGVEFSNQAAAAGTGAHHRQSMDAAAQHIHIRRLQQQYQRLMPVSRSN